uniref:G_PROTEIN_RECEP_F1_2 domain-containing protein n=1 Tax=Heligmosomoides polygyrus TaxID=6339 RepID=A0A183F716_HELPZ
LLLKYVVPPLMLLCLLGNLLNLLIYSLSYFDGSSSVHFLRAKAIFNMIFVWSRLLEVIHAWTNPAQTWLEPLFWHTRSYIMTISNISGTMSTWLVSEHSSVWRGRHENLQERSERIGFWSLSTDSFKSKQTGSGTSRTEAFKHMFFEGIVA